VRELTLEPLAAVCTWRAQKPEPLAAWAALLGQFLERLARASVRTAESGPTVIGHIKALATLPGGAFLRGSVVAARHAPDVQTGGALPDTLVELSFTVNVLVYGLSHRDAASLVEREAGRLAAELGAEAAVELAHDEHQRYEAEHKAEGRPARPTAADHPHGASILPKEGAMLEELTKKMGELEEQDVLALVKKELDAGTHPLAILEAGREGMAIVGSRFEAKEYFVSELMMAAEIFRELTALVAPRMKAGTAPSRGVVVFGTVQGDIHDIGKNIVVSMLRGAGYDVRDQGIDVPAAKFVAALKETGATVLGLSGLITMSYDGMKATIEALKAAGLRDKVKVMIGGGLINEEVRAYVGADAWGHNANEAVTLCGKLMGGK